MSVCQRKTQMEENKQKSRSANGHLAVVERLLQDQRVDPSANNQWAIRWSSKYGRLPVVGRLLQDPRVDPSSDNQFAIRSANENGHVEVVRFLLHNPRVDPSVVFSSYSI